MNSTRRGKPGGKWTTGRCSYRWSADAEVAERFVGAVDSGVVLVSASTMFCDGQSLGMCAEIGILTDRIRGCGPMRLEELTGCKFVIRGNGEWSDSGASPPSAC